LTLLEAALLGRTAQSTARGAPAPRLHRSIRHSSMPSRPPGPTIRS